MKKLMATGKGGIEKRGKNRWRLRINVGYKADGRPIRRYRTVEAKNKTEANRLLSQFVTEVETGQYFKPEKMTFGIFVGEWKTKYAQDELAPTTFYNYMKVIEKRLLPEFENMKLSDVKPFHIINFLDELKKPGHHTQDETKPLSNATLQINHRVIKNIFSRAVDWQLIKTNPVEKVPKPKVTNAKANAYDNDEIHTLFAALEHEPIRWQVMVNLVITTGLRRGEALGLEWKHIDLETGTLEVAQTVQYIAGQGNIIRPPKTGKPRKMALQSDVVDMLRAYKRAKTKEKLKAGDQWAYPGKEHFFVFSSWDGKPVHATSVGQWWNRFITRKGLKHIRFHDLRHTSATYLINQNVHPKMISERLGHADIQTTMNVYGHVLQQADRQTANVFDSIYTSNKKPSSSTE